MARFACFVRRPPFERVPPPDILAGRCYNSRAVTLAFQGWRPVGAEAIGESGVALTLSEAGRMPLSPGQRAAPLHLRSPPESMPLSQHTYRGVRTVVAALQPPPRSGILTFLASEEEQ
jgi:hypothetical protein